MAEREGGAPAPVEAAKPAAEPIKVEVKTGPPPVADKEIKPAHGGIRGFVERKAEERKQHTIENAINDRRAASARIETGEKRLEALKAATDPKEVAEREQLEKDLQEDRRQMSRANLELWKNGQIEKLDTKDLVVIEKDLIDSGEKSAIAELILSKQGFKTFEDALRKLKLTGVEYGGKEVTLEDENELQRFVKSPAVRDWAKKLGYSSIGPAALGAIVLAGGPVTWAAVGISAAAVGGGAVGRGVGEMIRGGMLRHKDKEDTRDGRRREFKTVVAEDLLQQIVNLQSQAEKQEAGAEQDPNKRAQQILELVQTASKVEGRTASRYQKMEKRASWIKAGLAMVGAVGASSAASMLAGDIARNGTEEAYRHAYGEAKKHGVRIFHDAGNQAHITADSAYGHVVRNDTDGAWRQVIEHKDLTGYWAKPNEFGGHIKGAADYMHHASRADGYRGVLDYWVSPGHGAGVPETLPGGPGLEHVATIDPFSVESALRENVTNIINHDTLIAEILGNVVGIGSVLAVEAGAGKKAKSEAEQRRKDNETLIASLGEVEDHLHTNIIMGVGETTPVGKIPDNDRDRATFIDRLAVYYHEYPPKGPADFDTDWIRQPQLLKKPFTLDQIPMWYKHSRVVDPTTGEKFYGWTSDEDPTPHVKGAREDAIPNPKFNAEGTLTKIGVAAVAPEKNLIAVVRNVTNLNRDKAYYFPVEVMRLDQFLEQYKPFIREEEGKSPAASDSVTVKLSGPSPSPAPDKKAEPGPSSSGPDVAGPVEPDPDSETPPGPKPEVVPDKLVPEDKPEDKRDKLSPEPVEAKDDEPIEPAKPEKAEPLPLDDYNQLWQELGSAGADELSKAGIRVIPEHTVALKTSRTEGIIDRNVAQLRSIAFAYYRPGEKTPVVATLDYTTGIDGLRKSLTLSVDGQPGERVTAEHLSKIKDYLASNIGKPFPDLEKAIDAFAKKYGPKEENLKDDGLWINQEDNTAEATNSVQPPAPGPKPPINREARADRAESRQNTQDMASHEQDEMMKVPSPPKEGAPEPAAPSATTEKPILKRQEMSLNLPEDFNSMDSFQRLEWLKELIDGTADQYPWDAISARTGKSETADKTAGGEIDFIEFVDDANNRKERLFFDAESKRLMLYREPSAATEGQRPISFTATPAEVRMFVNLLLLEVNKAMRDGKKPEAPKPKNPDDEPPSSEDSSVKQEDDNTAPVLDSNTAVASNELAADSTTVRVPVKVEQLTGTKKDEPIGSQIKSTSEDDTYGLAFQQEQAKQPTQSEETERVSKAA